MRRSTTVAVAAALLLLVGARHAPAQELQSTIERVAAAWHRGDTNAISGLGARAGMSLDVDGSSVGPLGPRQAAAVLRRVFEDRESLSAKVNMFRELAGEANRAFGEINWLTRARGTTEPERVVVFVSFVREESGWRVNEIRLLR